MLSPDKYIRAKYFEYEVSTFTFYLFDFQVPEDFIPIPSTYVLMSTQTKQIANETKCGHGWNCSILLDIISEQQHGFLDRSIVDDIETEILTAIDTWTFIKTDIGIQPFIVYYTKVEDSRDLSVNTPTKTIVRKLLRISHILNAVDTE